MSFERKLDHNLTVGADAGIVKAAATSLVLLEMVSTGKLVKAGWGAGVNFADSLGRQMLTTRHLVPSKASSADQLAAVFAEGLSEMLSFKVSEDVKISHT